MRMADIRSKTLSYEQAKAAPVYNEEGWRLAGWIWRPSSRINKWNFTASIDRRGYVHTAQFVPLYVHDPSVIDTQQLRRGSMSSEEGNLTAAVVDDPPALKWPC